MIEGKTRISKKPFREIWMQAIDLYDTKEKSVEAQMMEIAVREKNPIVMIAYEQVATMCHYLYRIGKRIYAVTKYGEK